MPGEAFQAVALCGPVVCECNKEGWEEIPDESCLEALNEELAMGFSGFRIGWPYVGYLDGLGMSSVPAIQYGPFTHLEVREGEWNTFDTLAEPSAGYDGVLALRFPDEPLSHGHSAEKIREGVYRVRRLNNWHPIAISDDTKLLYSSELEGLADVVVDNHYSNNDAVNGPFPACEFVCRVLETANSSTDWQALGIYQEVGYYGDDHRYWSVGADSVVIEALATLLLGASLDLHYSRFSWGDTCDPHYDLKSAAPRVWNTYEPRILPLADSLACWLGANQPHEVGFGPEGETVDECPIPPVMYGFGQWTGGLGEGYLGTWFLVANLGQDDEQELDLEWSLLGLPESGEVSIDLDGASDGFIAGGGIAVDANDEVRWSLPATAWVVGRLVWEPENIAGADDANCQRTANEMSLFPNPVRTRDAVYLRGRAGVPVSIEMYDVTGRRVRSIDPVLGSPSGTEIEWDDGSAVMGLSSGVYVTRISDGRAVVSGRLVVLE